MKPGVSCRECPNDRCLVKKHCPPKWVTIVSDMKEQQHVKKGKQVIKAGSAVLGLFFVCNGKIKVTALDGNKKEHIIRLAANGQVLGHRGFGDQAYPIGAAAMVESLVCFLTNELAHEVMLHNSEFTFGLMSFYSQELRDTEARSRNMGRMTDKQRVADSLLYMIKVFGLTVQKKLNVPVTLKEIGEMAGISTERAEQIISELKQEMILLPDKKDLIILNERKLRRLV